MKKLVLFITVISLSGVFGYSQTNIFPSSGKVGIGTITPVYKLSVISTSGVWGQGIENQGCAVYSAYAYSATDGLGQIITVNNNRIDRLALQVANPSSSLLYVRNDGNIGIGTTSPDYKLDVVGTIRAHHVKVNLDKAADFVFDPAYRLPKLSEVESYVKEHKHLPSVPSADEFNKNGMDVSEMNNLMLQKIEELTLYVIEQKKAVDSLKIENKKLKTQVEKIVNK